MLAALNARIPARALRTHDSEWGSQQSTVQVTNECSKIQVGDGVFHIINCDGGGGVYYTADLRQTEI
jgi:hypothetical protein